MFNIKDINFGCHQIPDRCLYFRGKPMPFCSRCFGCSIGHILSFILFLFGYLPSYLIAIILIIPLGIDWSIQRFFDILSNNHRRLVTGILGGFGIGIIIWKSVEFIIIYLK
jgi:uncharacterized membrane protein